MSIMKFYRYPREQHKCGRSPAGTPCAFGPVKGRCGQKASGDPGETCTPLRTLHWWNHTIQIVATLMALVGVSLACSNFGLKHVVTPGPLTVSHAQLLVSSSDLKHTNLIDESNRCAACHPGMSTNSKSNATNEVVAGMTQRQLCMKCHGQSMPDAIHGSPHDLDGPALQELIERSDTAPKSFLASFVSRSASDWKNHETECSQCHREHQGTMHTLQSMASDRCQSCHQNQFKSFSNGHPEFKDYPYDRPRNLAFDHIKHRDLHFTKKATEFDCKSCHVQSDQVGVVGQVFRSVSFEKACASCHAEPIKSAVQDGLIVLQLPSLNRKELMSRGLDIGSWPEAASQLTDGSIPPIMRWLLQCEPGGDELLKALPPSGRLADVDMNDEVSRKSLAELANLTKSLMRKLANDGQPGFRASAEQLISVRGPMPTLVSNTTKSPWLDRFAGGIPPDLFRAAVLEWFGDSNSSPTLAIQQPTTRPSQVRLSSQIKPTGDDDLLSGSDDLLVPDNKAKDLLSDSNDSLLGPTEGNSLLDSPAKGTQKETTSFKDARAWDQLGYGGWMIDRQRMAIVYVPRGHADPWLSQWVEFEEMRRPHSSAAGADAFKSAIAMAQQCRQCHSLTQSNAAPPAAHGANWQVAFRQANETHPNTSALLAQEGTSECWRANRRPANITQITKFNHTPHLTLPVISDCRSCHQLESKSDSTSGVTTGDASHAIHEFAPIQRNQCVNCHQPNAAGESCTQCHNYHVGLKAWFDGR